MDPDQINILDCMTVATLSEGDTEFWTYRYS